MAWQDYTFHNINVILQEDGNLKLSWKGNTKKTRVFLRKMYDYYDEAFFVAMIRGKKDLCVCGMEFEMESHDLDTGETEMITYESFGIGDKDCNQMWFFDNKDNNEELVDDLLCGVDVILQKHF